MGIAGRGTPGYRRRLGALVTMSLMGTLLFVGSLTVTATPADAAAAVPSGAPTNPTQPCTWNWNRWSRPGNFTFPYDDSSFDPTQAVFSQTSTALGGNAWYAASAAPDFSYSGLSEGTGPSEVTTGANDSEWTYGVGYYVMSPGSKRTITIADSTRQESHAFAFYNSAGEQFARYPRMAQVRSGVHYLASEEQEKSDPSLAGGLAQKNSWRASVTITVPDDGVVYIHYLNFDERLRTQFATFDGACGPVLAPDESSGNVPGQSTIVEVTANDANITLSSVSIVGSSASTGDKVVPGQGVWSVNSATGAITFTPERQFTSSPTPIRYVAADSRGRTGAPTSVTVRYLPVFTEDDSSLANVAGETVTVNVAANDSYINRRTIAIVGAGSITPTTTPSSNTESDSTSSDASSSSSEPQSSSQPAQMVSGLTELVVPNAGVWNVDQSAGTISFTPDEGYEDDPPPIRYFARDVGGNLLDPATVTVTYAPNTEPDESTANYPADSVWIDVLENDPSKGIDPTTVKIIGQDEQGELVVEDEGTWAADPLTGAITFVPEGGFAGDPEPQQYTVADMGGDFAKPTEIVVDYSPILRRDETSGNPAGGIVTIDVLANDPSNDLDPTSVAIDDPSYDKANRTLTVAGQGSWTVDPNNGSITYTPEPGNAVEPTPITYTAKDDEGGISPAAEFAVRYLPLPQTQPDRSDRNRLGNATSLDVLKNDAGPDLEVTSVQMVLGESTTRELVVPDEGAWRVDPVTGIITFTPDRGFKANPTPIQYVATDLLGVRTAPTTVTITYSGAVEALAFADGPPVAPMESRTSLLGLGFLAIAMLGASVALRVDWSRVPRPPLQNLIR